MSFMFIYMYLLLLLLPLFLFFFYIFMKNFFLILKIKTINLVINKFIYIKNNIFNINNKNSSYIISLSNI